MSEADFPALSPPVGEEGISPQALEAQAQLKQAAADALEDGLPNVALEKLTAAIQLGCTSALLYCRRARLLLQLDRPRAAANDCTAALSLNPDSGTAFKLRGQSNAKIGLWEEAHSDLAAGLRLDYDETLEELARSVSAKAKEIQASRVASRLRSQEVEHAAKRKEDKEKYEEGIRSREAERIWKLPPAPANPRLSRRSCFSHHIIAECKLEVIREWAAQLRLGVLMKIGWPGVLVIEGDERAVVAYVDALSALPWRYFKVRGARLVEGYPDQCVDDFRLLPIAVEEFGEDLKIDVLEARCQELGVLDLYSACISTGRKSGRGGDKGGGKGRGEKGKSKFKGKEQ
eukprot:gnl/TRDRNA2_/TRDRNA2_160631_c0_seq2.p1 gnl/TRDRNA2_/TRDRNA2_160631_c0~~gnl/TRDRNA2_/TRDRNA2_160631_c0_seq2.p1  ORF type:complete len:345 (+),score=91.85 gnl/TRDRNA2_/TRDRNA2_160631_c0_seq2:56-1090(+)